MLPPKPGKSKRSQQTIKLDIFCNPAGIKSAEKQAQQLASELALNQFSWDKWTIASNYQSIESVGYWVEKFEADYYQRKERNDKTETTWNSEYRAMFNRLPKNEKLSDRLLLDDEPQRSPQTSNYLTSPFFWWRVQSFDTSWDVEIITSVDTIRFAPVLDFLSQS